MTRSTIHRRDFLIMGLKTAGTAALFNLFPFGSALAAGTPVIDSFQSDPGELESLLKTATRKGGDYADIFLEQTASRRISLDNNQISSPIHKLSEGLAIRLKYDGKTAFEFVDGFLRKPARAAARKVQQSVHSGKKDLGLTTLPRRPAVDSGVIISPTRLDKTTPARVTEILKRLHSHGLTTSNLITDIKLEYYDEIRRILVANSRGRYVTDTQPLVDLSITCTARSGSRKCTVTHRISHRCGSDLLISPTVAASVIETAEKAVEALATRPVTGVGLPVVLMPEASAWLAWHLVHKIYPSEMNSNAQQQVFSPKVTLIDSGRVVNGRGSAHYDDEGNRTTEATAIRNGLPAEWLRYAPESAQNTSGPSGCVRRSGYSGKPSICPTNSFLQVIGTLPECDPEALESGLLVNSAIPVGSTENPDDVKLQVISGFKVENYIKIHPVRDIILTGRLPDILDRITACGSEVAFVPSTYRETNIPISCGAPALKLSLMNFEQR